MTEYKPLGIDRLEDNFVPSEQLQTAVTRALRDIQDRSFSARHPELGKMIKCQFCGRRHRETQQLYTHGAEGVSRASKFVGNVLCEQRFAESHIEEDVETGEQTVAYRMTPLKTMKQNVGSAAFKGKRRTRRGNQRGLQLVELTQELFPKYETMVSVTVENGIRTTRLRFANPHEAMVAARGEAAAILRRGRKVQAKQKRDQQKLSRRINRGLGNPGSRV